MKVSIFVALVTIQFLLTFMKECGSATDLTLTAKLWLTRKPKYDNACQACRRISHDLSQGNFHLEKNFY